MFESVDARMDARMPARVPSYKLTLWAFGSGELKKLVDFEEIQIFDKKNWLILTEFRFSIIIIENLTVVKINQFFFKIIFGLKSCLLFSAEFFTENSDIPVLMHYRTDALVNSALNRS